MELFYTATALPGLEILSCPNDRPFARHLHDGYVLWLNSEAGEHFRVKGGTDILLPGAISIIEPGIIHDNRPCLSHRRHLRSFYFTDEFLANIAEEVSGKGIPPGLPTTVISDQKLWRDVACLHEALLSQVSAMQAEEGILTLFARIFLHCKFLPHIDIAREDGRKVTTAIDYFAANLDRQITLAEVAHLVGCTGFHLIRLFRATKGVAPHTYLMQLRLEQARKLLNDGHSIVDAAMQSGFSDQSHLTRQFKIRFGLTPGRYRQQFFRQ